MTVADVITDSPASGITQTGFRTLEAPLDSRETQVVTLKGDIWIVGAQADDCDFHLELSGVGAGPNDDRIIVEIPQGAPFVAARNALLQALAANGVKPKAHKVLTKSIRVQVMGFLFYDAWHVSTSNPQRGHNHGSAQVATLWEIHPVFGIVFPQN
jgi:hypothetical protein